jgi:hypothetical protein
MLADIANVTMYTESYRNLSFDDDTVPFGQIKYKFDILTNVKRFTDADEE